LTLRLVREISQNPREKGKIKKIIGKGARNSGRLDDVEKPGEVIRATKTVLKGELVGEARGLPGGKGGIRYL